jgi:hypothetical protein
MAETIDVEQVQEEYSGSATITIDNIQFIDEPVVSSQTTSSNPSDMPLRQSGCVEYNFTEQETKFLTTENICVIDNLVGVYGDDLKIDRNDIIKLNKEFHGFEDEDNEPQYIESDFGDMIYNPKYNFNNQLKNAEAKLKQYKEDYIKIQHEYHIDKIKEFQQKIFDAWNNKKYLKKGDIMLVPMISSSFKLYHNKFQYYVD